MKKNILLFAGLLAAAALPAPQTTQQQITAKAGNLLRQIPGYKNLGAALSSFACYSPESKPVVLISSLGRIDQEIEKLQGLGGHDDAILLAVSTVFRQLTTFRVAKDSTAFSKKMSFKEKYGAYVVQNIAELMNGIKKRFLTPSRKAVSPELADTKTRLLKLAQEKRAAYLYKNGVQDIDAVTKRPITPNNQLCIAAHYAFAEIPGLAETLYLVGSEQETNVLGAVAEISIDLDLLSTNVKSLVCAAVCAKLHTSFNAAPETKMFIKRYGQAESFESLLIRFMHAQRRRSIHSASSSSIDSLDAFMEHEEAAASGSLDDESDSGTTYYTTQLYKGRSSKDSQASFKTAQAW
ncbi:hypothetical protein FJ366_02710 [Candidatus Dependentiae bacterium]|nr:hypothetical protein [Candidatus Dependentiae bacterium]